MIPRTSLPLLPRPAALSINTGRRSHRAVMTLFAAAALSLAALTTAPAVTAAPTPVAHVPETFADLVDKVSPAVVNITVTKMIEGPTGIEDFLRRFDPRRGGGGGAGPEDDNGPERQAPRRKAAGGGTGFIVEASGIIVTNNHVIEGADEITVRLANGDEAKAELIGTDPATDLAVLKIKARPGLATVKFGNSDAARVGDWVLTIGSPFGLGGSVTSGIISARNRDINTGLYDDFLQTDAPINPGNSGGPMFNMSGEVIGINTAIFSPSGGNAGIGFAIPSNLAKTIIAQLREKGKVQRGWLGVTFQPITRELADSLGLEKAEGALVASVTPGGPAEKAGIQSGDIIIEYEGKPITLMQRLPSLVANTPIGQNAKVTVLRKNQRKTLTVKIVERTEEEVQAGLGNVPGSGQEATALGMSLGTLTDDVRASLGLSAKIKGVVVLSVDPNSNAQAQGLRRGDVIVSVSLEDVATPKEVTKRIEEVKKSGRPSVLFRVYRDGNYSHITVSFK